MVSRNQSSTAEAGVRVLGSQDQLPGIIMPLIPFERMEVSPIPQGFRARAGEPPPSGFAPTDALGPLPCSPGRV